MASYGLIQIIVIHILHYVSADIPTEENSVELSPQWLTILMDIRESRTHLKIREECCTIMS